MNKYKLIAFDLDGTLLNKKMILTEEAKNGLKLIHAKGVKSAIITGRSIPNITPILKDLNIEYMAGLNGAHIYNNISKKSEYTSFIKTSLLEKALYFVKENNLSANFFSETKAFTTGLVKHKMTQIYQKTLNADKIENMSDKSKILSIQIMCNSGNSADIYLDKLCKLFKNELTIENTGFNFLQISNNNINKSNALKYITSKNNLTLDKTIAIGDSYSDLSMINSAGLGIGMCNGDEDFLQEVKVKTDFDNDSNGAIDFIIKNIL